MQIKMVLGHHYTSIKTAKIKKIMTIPNADEGAEKLVLSYITGGNVK